jgi:hypothetical protein
MQADLDRERKTMLILAPQRRSMVSSSPITTGAPDGTKAFTSRISS